MHKEDVSYGLLLTTYTYAVKPGCLMCHNWLHTPDCKHQMKVKHGSVQCGSTGQGHGVSSIGDEGTVGHCPHAGLPEERAVQQCAEGSL